jgi:hypothetical protein
MRLSLSILAPLLACSIYTQSLPAPIPTRQGTIIKKMCRTDNPSSEFRKAHENLQTQGSQLKARKANSSGQLLVDTYIHFVTTQDQALIYGVPGVLDRLISSQVNFRFDSIQKWKMRRRTDSPIRPKFWTNHMRLQTLPSTFFHTRIMSITPGRRTRTTQR